MAELTGPIGYHSRTSEVDSTQHIPFGTRGTDTSGNIYIYLDFQESCSLGEWVTWTSSYAASGMGSATHGPVGVVAGTVSASDRFGWAMIYGICDYALGTSDVATNVALLMQAASTDVSCPTAGTSAALVLETLMHGATAISAASTATTTIIPASFTVQLNFPFCYGTMTT